MIGLYWSWTTPDTESDVFLIVLRRLSIVLILWYDTRTTIQIPQVFFPQVCFMGNLNDTCLDVSQNIQVGNLKSLCQLYTNTDRYICFNPVNCHQSWNTMQIWFLTLLQSWSPSIPYLPRYLCHILLYLKCEADVTRSFHWNVPMIDVGRPLP